MTDYTASDRKVIEDLLVEDEPTTTWLDRLTEGEFAAIILLALVGVFALLIVGGTW